MVTAMHTTLTDVIQCNHLQSTCSMPYTILGTREMVKDILVRGDRKYTNKESGNLIYSFNTVVALALGGFSSP